MIDFLDLPPGNNRRRAEPVPTTNRRWGILLDGVFVTIITLAVVYSPLLAIDDLWRPRLSIKTCVLLGYPVLGHAMAIMTLFDLRALRDTMLMDILLGSYPVICLVISFALYRRSTRWFISFLSIVFLNSVFGAFVLKAGLSV